MTTIFWTSDKKGALAPFRIKWGVNRGVSLFLWTNQHAAIVMIMMMMMRMTMTMTTTTMIIVIIIAIGSRITMYWVVLSCIISII